MLPTLKQTTWNTICILSDFKWNLEKQWSGNNFVDWTLPSAVVKIQVKLN